METDTMIEKMEWIDFNLTLNKKFPVFLKRYFVSVGNCNGAE